MKELLEHIVKNLVDNPSAVIITESEENNVVSLRLNVSPQDMGKIIGKQGRVAKSIRSIMKAGAINSGKYVVVEIV
jgi:uncharacterized protein